MRDIADASSLTTAAVGENAARALARLSALDERLAAALAELTEVARDTVGQSASIALLAHADDADAAPHTLTSGRRRDGDRGLGEVQRDAILWC